MTNDADILIEDKNEFQRTLHLFIFWRGSFYAGDTDFREAAMDGKSRSVMEWRPVPRWLVPQVILEALK